VLDDQAVERLESEGIGSEAKKPYRKTAEKHSSRLHLASVAASENLRRTIQ
jgi:hypothetical protein